MNTNQLVMENIRLPHILYHSSFRGLIDEDECIGVGNLELVKASRQWSGEGRFADYAAKAIFHAVRLARTRDCTVRGGPLSSLRRAEMPELTADPVNVEDAEALTRVMDRLSAEDRELLVEHFLSGLTEQRMADRRGIPKSNLHRALVATLRRARSIAEVLCNPCS